MKYFWKLFCISLLFLFFNAEETFWSNSYLDYSKAYQSVPILKLHLEIESECVCAIQSREQMGGEQHILCFHCRLWFLKNCPKLGILKFENACARPSPPFGENKWEGSKLETHLFSHRQHNSFSLRKTSTNIFKFLDFSIPGSPRDNKNASVTIDDIMTIVAMKNMKMMAMTKKK